MGRYEDLIDRFFELQNESDEERRRGIADEVLTEDIEFYGVTGQVSGRDEFVAWFRNDEGSVLVRTSEVEEHRGWLRNGWEFRLPDGRQVRFDEGDVSGGLQISQLSADGRLRRLVAFRGLTPAGSR